ncbi:hypothetical protein FHX81_6897 [Saccharothrix saharensis]|uniref:Uncharacterized protein n=1 Tax=Saccharothrix saharensis TaxID=571190 RepID=A0A543JNL3_9PSEU|nr:hypothetical protein [Saccharothrix saharensis]TQM84451.1 hypothetical protein FHX81_6897 [Saccharothrix saharensis]
MKTPALLLACLLLAACGIATQSEPRPLTTPTAPPAPTPTVTQRPDPTTSSATTTTGRTAEPTPLSTRNDPRPG